MDSLPATGATSRRRTLGPVASDASPMWEASTTGAASGATATEVPLDASVVLVVVFADPAGVDLVEDTDTVAGPGGNSGGGSACGEPERHRRVPEGVRRSCSRWVPGKSFVRALVHTREEFDGLIGLPAPFVKRRPPSMIPRSATCLRRTRTSSGGMGTYLEWPGVRPLRSFWPNTSPQSVQAWPTATIALCRP
jgi:hypothetical protein